MPRNLVICCDGTNNQFGRENTNVVRLVQVLERDPARQLVYYDPGVGTLPEPGVWTAIGKKFSEVIALAFATDLERKVAEAYTYLMSFWEPGDPVFFFGFSRGAYTVRVLAAMLHGLGLLPRGNENLLPYLQRLFRSLPASGQASAEETSWYWRLSHQFRSTFAREVPDDPKQQRRCPVHFLGLWDTVSSVGWLWDPRSYPFTTQNPSITVIRQAIAIDERRAFYRQNLMQASKEQDVKQYWFPGVHADVGGGYPPEEGGLWRLPFQWLASEARSAGLLIDSARMDQVMHPTAATPGSWADHAHDSLTPLWWLAEFFPKLVWQEDRGWALRLGRGQHRLIRDGSSIHQAALLRIREANYNPANLSEAFVKAVRALADVPEALTYVSGTNTRQRLDGAGATAKREPP